jgi:hypothetical protein
MARGKTEGARKTRNAQRSGHGSAVVLFLAGALLFCWPWLSGAVTIPWDAKAHFYPQLVFLARALHEGQSPFWTPNVFGGHPQIADPQSLIFSPPHFLLALFDRAPSFVAFDALVFAMLVMGGLALIALFRDRGWRAEGALVAALAFAFGCSAAWRVQHVGQIISLSWFAVALWLLMRAIDGRERPRSWVWGAAAGLAAGVMLVGRDQVAWLCAIALAILAVGRAIEAGLDGGGFRETLRALAKPLGAGALVGALVIALPFAFTLALAAQSNRAAITFEGAAGGSLHPAAFFTFVSANFFGTDGPLKDYWGPPSSLVWGETGLALARNMANVYMGALPFVALLCLGVLRGGFVAREMRAFTIAALFMLLYALGRYTPFFTLAFHLPGADLFRRPADATFPLGALLAIIAGYCVHRLFAGDWRAKGRRMALEAGVVALAFLACVFIAFDKGRLQQAAPMLAASCAWLAASLAFLWLAPRWRRGALAPLAALALLLAFDLRANNGPNESTALPPDLYEALRPDARDPVVDALRERLAQTQGPDRRDRVELSAIDFHWPNASLVHGFDHWLGYNPLRLRWYADATGAIDHVAVADQRRFSPLFARYNSPMADLMGLRWIASGPPAGDLDKRLAPGDLRPVANLPTAHLYENPRALPRVLLVGRARKADFDAMIASGRWPPVDLREAVLLEDAPEGLRPRAPGSARIAAYRNTQVDVNVEAPDGGWLVLNDVWHPWWRVEVDGKPARLLRANVIFRAVEVPAGAKSVSFRFAPFAGLAAQAFGRSP